MFSEGSSAAAVVRVGGVDPQRRRRRRRGSQYRLRLCNRVVDAQDEEESYHHLKNMISGQRNPLEKQCYRDTFYKTTSLTNVVCSCCSQQQQQQQHQQWTGSNSCDKGSSGHAVTMTAAAAAAPVELGKEVNIEGQRAAAVGNGDAAVPAPDSELCSDNRSSPSSVIKLLDRSLGIMDSSTQQWERVD